MHELCGVFTMLNYTATIFRDSGSTISPNFSAIIVGFIQLLGTYVATFLVDRLGRKILLVFSSIGTSLCLACLGAYSYCNSIGIDVKPYSWVSIASFSGMMFLAACGIIPLMFVVISEVMPEKVCVSLSLPVSKHRRINLVQNLFSGAQYRMHNMFLSVMGAGICHGEVLWVGGWSIWHARMGVFLCDMYTRRNNFHCYSHSRDKRQKLRRHFCNFKSIKVIKIFVFFYSFTFCEGS